MINAFEAAKLWENSKQINQWKQKIEKTIMEHIENPGMSLGRSVCLSCDTDGTDDFVIDTYIIPWLSNLRYKAYRNHGDAGHDGPYNNLIIQW